MSTLQQDKQEYAVTSDHVSAPDPEDFSTISSEQNVDGKALAKINKTSSVLMVLVSGLALFSDGFNAQVIGKTIHQYYRGSHSNCGYRLLQIALRAALSKIIYEHY